MRDLLRLLGIAVLVFLLVGFAMIYSRDSAFRYGVSSFLNGTGGAISRGFSDLTGGGDPETELAATTLRIARANQTSWVGLAGFPDQTEVHFPMPRLGGHVEGKLELLFDVQLAQGGDGLLTISVNGERRDEIVLNTGNNGYEVSIPLRPSDLLGERIVVGLAARGTTNSGQICPTDAANSGSAISLLPESSLVLSTLQIAADPETALIAAAEPLQLYLGADQHAQTVAVWAAQYMARAGVSNELVEEALTPRRIVVTDNIEAPPVQLDPGGNIVLNAAAGVERAISFHRAEAAAPAVLSGWPVTAGQLTTETMARNFRGSKRWTMPYKIADLPGGLTPTRLDLALRTSLLDQDYQWVVRVSLNGNLVQTNRLPGNVPDIRLSVELPVALQGLSNSLLVELIDTSPNQSICRAAPDAQAQLLPETRLTADGAQPQAGWGAIVRKLSQAAAVSPGNHGLLDADLATRAAAMLMQFLPADANVAFASELPPMTIAVLDKGAMAAFLETYDKSAPGETWLVSSVRGTPVNPLGLYNMADLNTDTLVEAMHSSSVVILVQRPPDP